jgi:hypothetical protein
LGKLIQEGVDVPVGEGKTVFDAKNLVAAEVAVTAIVGLAASTCLSLAGVVVIGTSWYSQEVIKNITITIGQNNLENDCFILHIQID